MRRVVINLTGEAYKQFKQELDAIVRSRRGLTMAEGLLSAVLIAINAKEEEIIVLSEGEADPTEDECSSF